MANETNPPRQSTAPSVPERVLRIDGERTAAMYSLAIRVSRLDQRLRDLAGVSTVEGRKQYRQATEGFQKHIAQFEDGLAEVEKDADVNSRRGGRTNSNAQQRRGAPQRQQQTNAGAISGKPAPAPQQTSQPAETKATVVAAVPQTPIAATAAPAPEQPKAAEKPQAKPQQKPQPVQQSPQPKSGQANGQANSAGNKQNSGGKGKGPKKSGATPQQHKSQQPQAVATVTL
ncbi:hypothetical protein [Pseudomonas violetae]|uniref:Uncharacterized protein n=1 Tax=Pseudomonas violetae TaxID=2915813 RepID=A0ABT0ET60_9PSED|nr:hypothetical protein [Pseudomonas violetae]MCK1788926.1 hypothetical protein [Pseudomonas violetae]